MKRICKNCHWWGQFADVPAKFGTCKNKHIIYGNSAKDRAGFYYWDHEEWWAYHMVGKNFGCIHWRAKE